jgi:hypothetical protein
MVKIFDTAHANSVSSVDVTLTDLVVLVAEKRDSIRSSLQSMLMNELHIETGELLACALPKRTCT